MTEKIDIKKKKCTTPEFRVSYPYVFQRATDKAGNPTKFRITMLFPKDADLAPLKRAVFNARKEKFGGDKSTWPKIKMPWRDGDTKPDREGYPGHWFIAASCKTRPGVVDEDVAEITEQSGDFYAGCYAQATLIAFYYNENGNEGLSFALQNIQKLRDGKPFSGRLRPEDEFEPVARKGNEGEDDEDFESEDDGGGF